MGRHAGEVGVYLLLWGGLPQETADCLHGEPAGWRLAAPSVETNQRQRACTKIMSAVSACEGPSSGGRSSSRGVSGGDGALETAEHGPCW